MVVLNDKDVRQKTGVILEQKSNLMGEETVHARKMSDFLQNTIRKKNKKYRALKFE